MKNKISTLAGILLLALGSTVTTQAASVSEIITAAQASTDPVASIKQAIADNPGQADAIVEAAVKAFPNLKASIVAAALSVVPASAAAGISVAADKGYAASGFGSSTEGNFSNSGSNSGTVTFPSNPGDLISTSPSGPKE